ncbi:ABC transporter permease [Idiomarina xiamenensis]|uniref:ABC transporter permease n=1 Tax=Idiomarina xiamenensis 10-D-4 TaxID=740709 RepID=K2KXZ0_9GAMM|nr:ABC transporter permease [Idiomarina xiamenensis]EKE87439.1 ABC transporter permease [Idiomarina xiamenensis 10-D-4]
MLKLALASLQNRRASALLTLLAIAVSVALLLAVERVRDQVQDNFANTVSGTDLIVGARTGQTQLLLASVFHIGALSNNLSWDSYEAWRERPEIAWSIPLSLGDSVRGLPVVATTDAFFTHFQYGLKRSLELQQGQWFAANDQVVLGADAAKQLGLKMGDDLVVAHGAGGISFSEHDEHPFHVSGVLAFTGTPVDQAVYVSLSGMGLIHGDLADNGDEHEHATHDEHEHEHEHEHHHAAMQDGHVTSISAALFGLKVKPLAIRLQREINNYDAEPLSAIMPGLTLQQLWKTLNIFERALTAVSAMVVVTGLLGMLTTLLASLRERRREMAVLRAVGARPAHVFTLLVSEAVLLTVLGCFAGLVILYASIGLLGGWIHSQTGMMLSLSWPTVAEWYRLALVVAAGFILSLVPAWRAYKNSLADGLSVKL